MDKESIISVIKDVLRGSFSYKLTGDTPTDALQLANKRYVDSQNNFFLQESNIGAGSTSKVVAHGLGAKPTLYGISPSSQWYYSPTGKTYTVSVTADATNLTLNKYPDGTIQTDYMLFARL